MIVIIVITITIKSKTIQNYQKDTIKTMLQYLPPIAQCTKKVKHTLNNHAAFAARFSKCFRLLRSITQ